MEHDSKLEKKKMDALIKLPRLIALTVVLGMAFSKAAAYADQPFATKNEYIPVNDSVLKCVVEKHADIDSETGSVMDLFWAIASYQNTDGDSRTYRAFLKGGHDQEAVESACAVLIPLKAEAAAQGGYLKVEIGERHHESSCYLETRGGWAPRPTGSSYRTTVDINVIRFSSDLSLKHEIYSTRVYQDSTTCDERLD